MAHLPARLKFWRDYIDWFKQDAGYWYFPKGRNVQSRQVIEAFRILKDFEGHLWNDAQGHYLNELKEKGLFVPQARTAGQKSQDATAMARMWKVVFSTLGIAWVMGMDKLSLTPAGRSFLTSNNPSAIIEKQVQRYQLTNPGIIKSELKKYKIRPHIFLLEVLLNCDLFLTHDEYILFVSRAREHEDLDRVSKFISKWRKLSDKDKEMVREKAVQAHTFTGRRKNLVNTIRLNKAYALRVLTFPSYLSLEAGKMDEVAVRLKASRRHTAERIVRKFRSEAVFIEFASKKDWFAYYGDFKRFPSKKDATDYYIDTGQTDKLGKVEISPREMDAQISERILEDFLEKNIHLLEDGLVLVRRQYSTVAGRIDLLCKDANDNYVVVELKKGRATDRVVGQTLRYIGFVKSEMLDDSDQEVRGIIVTRKVDRNLELAITGLGKPFIEIRNI